MKNHYNKHIIGCICIICTLLFVIIFQAVKPRIINVQEASGDIKKITYINNPDTGSLEKQTISLKIGTDVTAVRINDLTNLQSITKVNYIPDTFVYPTDLPHNMQIIDLTKSQSLAKKGTLIFVILNLDPSSPNFVEQTNLLKPYKIGDYWHFTLAIPTIFFASNIYQRAQLISRHGTIENYDFTNFNTSYDKFTENYSSNIEYTHIDLPFYTKREALDNATAAAQIITIHYQSENTSFSGLKEFAFIGTERAVKNIHKTSSNLSISFAIISIVVLSMLIVLSILKHTPKFISEIIMIFGIIVFFFSEFVIIQTTSYPLFWISMNLASIFITLSSTLFSIGKNFKYIPLKYIIFFISFLGIILSLISPFMPYDIYKILQILCSIIKYITIIFLVLYLSIGFFSNKEEEETVKLLCGLLILVIIITSLIFPNIKPNYLNASFWLSAIFIAITFISVFKMFLETEKRNQYLNSNLHLEVERQTKDIKAVISERDHLLQFVSHDMKKPLSSSLSLIDVLIERETNIEQTKTLKIVKQNTNRVINNLSEIGHYAKYNYIAEASQIISLKKLLKSICQFHTPDCNANGIILKNLITEPYRVFVKPQGLENAISNIIINAIEHANCTTITLQAKSEKNRVILCISDNGKGICPNIDAFKPYVSENKPDTGGLGLYICKSIIETMNGTLSYQSREGKTDFYISLLKA